jgi:excisionase family DNA binding protein
MQHRDEQEHEKGVGADAHDRQQSPSKHHSKEPFGDKKPNRVISFIAKHHVDRHHQPHAPYMTTREVAKCLRCKPATVQRYARAGLLPGRKVGRSYLFAPRDVEAFLARH